MMLAYPVCGEDGGRDGVIRDIAVMRWGSRYCLDVVLNGEGQVELCFVRDWIRWLVDYIELTRNKWRSDGTPNENSSSITTTSNTATTTIAKASLERLYRQVLCESITTAMHILRLTNGYFEDSDVPSSNTASLMEEWHLLCLDSIKSNKSCFNHFVTYLSLLELNLLRCQDPYQRCCFIKELIGGVACLKAQITTHAKCQEYSNTLHLTEKENLLLQENMATILEKHQK